MPRKLGKWLFPSPPPEVSARRQELLRRGIVQPPSNRYAGRQFLAVWLADFAAIVTVPSHRRRVRWLPRAGPKGIAIHIAVHTVLGLAIAELMIWGARAEAQQEELKRELARDLGREPTEDEVRQALRDRLTCRQTPGPASP